MHPFHLIAFDDSSQRLETTTAFFKVCEVAEYSSAIKVTPFSRLEIGRLMEVLKVVGNDEKKDLPDKHCRNTHTVDMQRCTFLVRGTKACKNRSSAESNVCQYHEPSRLAKERSLSILTKRPRSVQEDVGLVNDEVERTINNNFIEELERPNVEPPTKRNDITRISGSQNRMYNPLATPLVDVAIGLPSATSWGDIFQNPDLPVHIDIGCARGIFLIDLAEMSPTRNFIGIEIRNKLVDDANEALKTSKSGHKEHKNCVFYCANLLSESHQKLLEDSSKHLTINRVSILFPDPWIKKKHQARRVVQLPVVMSLSRILCRGGELIISSDVESVIQDARTKLEACTDVFEPVKGAFSETVSCGPNYQEPVQVDKNSSYEIDEHGFVISNPFRPLASEREQVCEMCWRRVFRLVYLRI